MLILSLVILEAGVLFSFLLIHQQSYSEFALPVTWCFCTRTKAGEPLEEGPKPGAGSPLVPGGEKNSVRDPLTSSRQDRGVGDERTDGSCRDGGRCC